MTTTYVMTGATSGIGAKALDRLTAEPDTRVLIGARNPDQATVPAGVEVLPLDLSSLDSVRAFATDVQARLDGAPIDRLVLNAGINGAAAGARSADGFDLTFATNHLSHYLLARLLLDQIAENGRVILTTSDTHDPKTIGIGPKRLDIDGWASGTTSTRLSYPASKLGNLMTAESIAALSGTKDKGIVTIGFNPGLTGDTGLNRSMPAAARLLMRALRPVLYLVSFLKPAVYVNTAENAGNQLAGLADGTITPPGGRVYASIVRGRLTYPDPSQLAQDTKAIETMWTRSAELVGLDPNTSA